LLQTLLVHSHVRYPICAVGGKCDPRHSSVIAELDTARPQLKEPWTHEERTMNTPNAAWTAAVATESPPNGSSERQDASASTAWNPFEVWRTRVLEQPPISGPPAGKADSAPRPFLVIKR